VVLAALWLFIVTKTVIAIGVGALALLIAGDLRFRPSSCVETNVNFWRAGELRQQPLRLIPIGDPYRLNPTNVMLGR
jgi:hypothetical protein